MEGTSIHDLQYNNSRNEEHYVNHSGNHPGNDEQYHNHPHQHPQHNPQQMQKHNEQIDIDELARDISENLNDKEPFAQETDDDNKESLTFSIPHDWKDPLILLIIYVILSQASVRQLFGKYISFINPNEEGIVSQSGIIIYGIILIALYMIIKKFL